MSWVDWVNGYIINHTNENTGEQTYGICRRGVIAAYENGAIWGETNFAFMEYDMKIEDDNGKEISGKVNEFNNLKKAWENNGVCKEFGGIRMNNEKFVLSKFDADNNTMYLTCSGVGGACVTKSEQCFVIGVYYKAGELTTSTGAKKNFSNGNCNAAVENCRDKLVEAGY